MKKEMSEQSDKDGMRNEYDFTRMTGGVRGKYYKAYRAGHTVKILKDNETSAVQHFKLGDNSALAPLPIQKISR